MGKQSSNTEPTAVVKSNAAGAKWQLLTTKQ